MDIDDKEPLITSRRRAVQARCDVADSKPTVKQMCRERRRLLLWRELPEWQREDNSHVESGYRVATPSVAQCLESWRYLHNESGISVLTLY